MKLDVLELTDKYDVFVLDLDNTLYDEMSYLDAAYSEIARWLSVTLSIDKNEVEKYLTGTFRKTGRKNLFNNLETHFSIKPSYIDKYLDILRTVKLDHKLPMSPPLRELLIQLEKKRHKIAILTNGNPQQQGNKINHIDWPISLNTILIVYANEIEPKPSPKGLSYIKKHFDSGSRMVFIGDSPVDQKTAANANVDYIDVSDLRV